jgi:hypothetical protein
MAGLACHQGNVSFSPKANSSSQKLEIFFSMAGLASQQAKLS